MFTTLFSTKSAIHSHWSSVTGLGFPSWILALRHAPWERLGNQKKGFNHSDFMGIQWHIYIFISDTTDNMMFGCLKIVYTSKLAILIGKKPSFSPLAKNEASSTASLSRLHSWDSKLDGWICTYIYVYIWGYSILYTCVYILYIHV